MFFSPKENVLCILFKKMISKPPCSDTCLSPITGFLMVTKKTFVWSFTKELSVLKTIFAFFRNPDRWTVDVGEICSHRFFSSIWKFSTPPVTSQALRRKKTVRARKTPQNDFLRANQLDAKNIQNQPKTSCFEKIKYTLPSRKRENEQNRGVFGKRWSKA